MAILSASPYADFVATIAARLLTVAPTVRGVAEDHPLDTPPRYRWGDAGISPPKKGHFANDGPKPSLGSRWFHAKVECWGKTEDDAFTLYNALLQAIDDEIGGSADIGEAAYDEPSTVEEGYKYLVDVRMLFQIPRVDLPATAQTPNATGETHPAETVEPVTFPTVQPESWEFDTTTAPTPVTGDGILNAGETP